MSGESTEGQVTPAAGEVAQPEVTQDQVTTTEGQTDGQTVETEESPAEKTFTQKELDEILTKRLAKAQRKARQEALQEFQALTQKPEPARQAADDKPTRAQYADDDAYIEAMTDWKLDQRDKVAAQERAKEQQKTLAQKTESIYAEAEKLDGFDRETFDELPLTRPIVEALIESDNAPALMKHMANNPDDIERIARLSPARQAAELGKLEAKLAAEPAPKPKVSSAPQPINAVRKPSAAAKTYDTTDPRAAKELSTSEWIKAEEARMRRQRAGQT